MSVTPIKLLTIVHASEFVLPAQHTAKLIFAGHDALSLFINKRVIFQDLLDVPDMTPPYLHSFPTLLS